MSVTSSLHQATDPLMHTACLKVTLFRSSATLMAACDIYQLLMKMVIDEAISNSNIIILLTNLYITQPSRRVETFSSLRVFYSGKLIVGSDLLFNEHNSNVVCL